MKRNEITFEKFVPTERPELMDELVECYRQVFAATPWFEWKVCSNCDKKWGIEHEQELTELDHHHCDNPVEDFWPVGQVRKDILHETSGEHSACWLALDQGKVVGFCWGYGITPTELEEKLEFPGLADTIHKHFDEHALVAYQDDMGLLNEYRGKGLAKALMIHRQRDFVAMDLPVGIMRTKKAPPTITYLWFDGKLDYKTIGEYNDADERVILARSFVGLLEELETPSKKTTNE